MGNERNTVTFIAMNLGVFIISFSFGNQFQYISHLESRWVPPEGYVPKAERLEKETADANENVEEMQEHPEETEERTEETQQTEKADTSDEELDETRGVKRKLVSIAIVNYCKRVIELNEINIIASILSIVV